MMPLWFLWDYSISIKTIILMAKYDVTKALIWVKSFFEIQSRFHWFDDVMITLSSTPNCMDMVHIIWFIWYDSKVVSDFSHWKLKENPSSQEFTRSTLSLVLSKLCCVCFNKWRMQRNDLKWLSDWPSAWVTRLGTRPLN